MRTARTNKEVQRQDYRILTFLLASTCIHGVTRANELTAAQQKMLKEAESHMGQVTTNLKLAQEATAGGQVSSSKSKLGLTRLASARQSAEEVKARLAELPKGHPDVQKLQQQLDEASKAIDAQHAVLTQTAPASSTTPTSNAQAPVPDRPVSKSPAGDAGAKLDYKQEEELKNARFNVREVEGLAGGAKVIATEVKAAADPKTMDFHRVKQGFDTIAKAKERAEAARDRLDKLPPNGAGVKEVSDELAFHLSSLSESQGIIDPAYKKLEAAVNPGSYPNFASDLARLRELGAMFSNANVFVEDRAKAATLVIESQAAAAEHDRIVKLYADLIRQQTPEGKQMEGAGRHFTEKMAAFSAEAATQKGSLPAQIDADLQGAIKDADDAVARQNPVFFQGAVSQKLGFAEEKLALFAALDPAAYPAVQKKYDSAKVELNKRQESLKASIIASNELPPDRYSGPDRDQLVAIATEAWLKVQPGAKTLVARIPLQQWKHETMWRHQTDAWYKIDRSKLQVQLIVVQDDQLAAVRPVDLWKDHLNGDQITASPMHAAKDELRPQDLIPLAKVK